jgi:hypothetical protein
VAERDYGSSHVQFIPTDEYAAKEPLDLVLGNGVHPVPVFERAGAVNLIHNSAGAMAYLLVENTPWNPLIQLLMDLPAIDRP